MSPGLEQLLERDRERADAGREAWGRPRLTVEELVGERTLQADERAVFARAWLPVIRTDELAAAGDWRRVDIGRLRWLAVRDEDGAIRVHENTCPHRGWLLKEEERGHHRSLVCGYHGLAYGLDGRLLTDGEQLGFSGAETCLRSLRPVRTASWGGWVWACAAPDTPPLELGSGHALDELLVYDLDRLQVFDRWSVVVDLSWRLAVDAFIEALHVPLLHQRTIAPLLQPFRKGGWSALGDHRILFAGFRLPGVFGPDGALGRPGAAAGVHPLPRLSPFHLETNLVVHLFPNLVLNLLPTHATAIRVWPLPGGHCRLTHDLLGPPTSGDGLTWFAKLAESYRRLVEEDLVAARRAREGLAAHDPSHELPLSWYERGLHHFHDRLNLWHARSAEPEHGSPSRTPR